MGRWRWLGSNPATLFLLLSFGLFIVSFYYFPHLHRALVIEDALGEYLQFFLYFAAALCFFVKTFKCSNRFVTLKKAGLALLLFLLAFEEISWGTRIFNFDIAWLSARTTQKSADLHNLVPLYGNKAVYIAFFLGMGPLLGYLEKFFLKKQSPDFSNSDHMLSYILAAAMLGMLWNSPYVFVWEYSELFIAASFFILGLRNLSLPFWKSFVVPLALALCFWLLGIGDSSRLDYGGMEWGAAPPALNVPH